MRRVNNTAGNIRYKPGERRERQKAKVKQEDFTKTDYQEEFPQLGASPTKAPKVAKQPAPISNQKSSPTVNKADVVKLQNKLPEETILKHKDSAPVESPQNKVDPYSSQKPATKTPQPTPPEALNLAQGIPIQMPSQMQPGTIPAMQPNMMQMPFMRNMMMMPQMGMNPQMGINLPFVIHPQMPSQFPTQNVTPNLINTTPNQNNPSTSNPEVQTTPPQNETNAK